LAITQVKAVEPENPALSVAVTVTDDEPAVEGVPLIEPVEASIDSPAGRPVAAQATTAAPGDESEAAGATGVMAEPETLDRAPRPEMPTVLVTVQEKVVEPE
jgi:hypothetical protein